VSNVKTVRAISDAFGRGGVSTLLTMLETPSSGRRRYQCPTYHSFKPAEARRTYFAEDLGKAGLDEIGKKYR
jgi:hypothetical protein